MWRQTLKNKERLQQNNNYKYTVKNNFKMQNCKKLKSSLYCEEYFKKKLFT
jgi:hypothetical protein